MTAEQWADARAKDVLDGEMLDGFLALPLEAKLVGIAVFASIGGETEVRDVAMEAWKTVQGANS
jgi:hypothetical protein